MSQLNANTSALVPCSHVHRQAVLADRLLIVVVVVLVVVVVSVGASYSLLLLVVVVGCRVLLLFVVSCSIDM